MSDLQRLYQLQQAELQLKAAKKKLKNLPAIIEFAQLKTEFADAKETLAWAKTKLMEQKRRIKRLESDLLQTEADRQEAQEELYGDHGQSVKELEQLGRKVELLDKERAEKEEMLIMAMEGKEELDKALDKAKSNYQELQAKLLVLQKEGNAEIKILKAEIQSLQEQCQEIRAQIEKTLLTEFQQLRKKFHDGRPIARVENDICTGCRVQVYMTLKYKLREGSARVYCESCGRLLIPSL